VGFITAKGAPSRVESGGLDLCGRRFSAAEIDDELDRLIKQLQSLRRKAKATKAWSIPPPATTRIFKIRA
jgi:hypothetical protein